MRPSAADLVSFMDFFDRKGILPSALRVRFKHDGRKVSQYGDEVAE